MMAEPMKTLELHYSMIQFFVIRNILSVMDVQSASGDRYNLSSLFAGYFVHTGLQKTRTVNNMQHRDI